ncbi:MAG: murein biosynthesis integral membrane protein MurJ [Pseudomonadota bacterium]|nr:murein biosynthesis integral membrane protein MurJ [Pseudomonadota bacterium]
MSFMRAFATVSGLTMISRLLGFVRDLTIAAFMGAGPVADAFFVAFKLPNFFRRLSAEGAFSVAFIPLFSGKLETEGVEAARGFTNRAFALMLAILIPFTILMILAMPVAIMLLAPGFADEPDRFALAVLLGRIMFPFLLLVSLVALLGGMLNAMGRFAPFAAAPILLNVCMIAAVVGLTPFMPGPAYALSVGVLVAGILQLVALLIVCQRAGMGIRLCVPRLSPDMRRLLKLMAPGLVGAGVVQINLFIGVVLASLLPAGAVSWLYYADRLNQLPLGVIGIAVGTALLPMLAAAIKTGDDERRVGLFSRGLEVALVLTLPAALALMLIPEPLIGVLFERGAFSAADTARTASALALFAIGLPAYVLVKIFSTAFFAAEDTTTPVKAAACGALTSLMLGGTLIWVIGHLGIALATSLAAWLQVAILARGLYVRGALVVDDRLKMRLWRILAACAIMVAGLVIGRLVMEPVGLTGLAILVVGGFALYVGAAIALGAMDVRDLDRLLRSRT